MADPTGDLKAVSSALTQTFEAMKKSVNSLIEPLQRTAKALAGGLSGGATAAAGAAGKASSGIEGMIPGLSMMTGALTAAVTALTAFITVATLTAGALNPAAVEVLGQAFKDLTATIGVAFEPAIHLMTKGVEQISAAILPLMTALRPAITQLVDVFLRVLVPAVRFWATLIQALTPILTPLIIILEGWADVIVSLYTIIQTLLETITAMIAGLLGSSINDAALSVSKALQLVAQQLVLFVATIAAKLGMM